MRYAKALIAVCTAVLLAAQTAFPMSVGAHGWVTVVLAGLGAFGVFQIPNQPMPEVPPAEARTPLAAGPIPQPRTPFFDPPAPPTIAPPVPERYTIMTPPKED